MDRKSISELDSDGLMELVRGRQLDEIEVVQVLRSPFCTAQIAERIASDPGLMGTHEVREKLAGFPGFTFGRALDLLATLPWTSLLSLSQSPRTPPVVRRQAERKLLSLLASMALGEKIALARRAHREIFRVLIGSGDAQVLSALLNTEPPPEFFGELANHRKWAPYIRVRRALVVCPHTPLPLALSLLVQFSLSELRRVLENPDLSEKVREAGQSLLEREASGQRRMIDFSGDDSDGGGAQSPEGFR
jgi:hypothetical protein